MCTQSSQSVHPITMPDGERGLLEIGEEAKGERAFLQVSYEKKYYFLVGQIICV